jgi:ADP-ribose pyrophosphatase YjhB (NUDIX family)
MTSKITRTCPRCGHESEEFRNPVPTVDIIIEIGNRGVVLVRRKNPPVGWALPGGFVDYGETLEEAAAREAMEETSLAVTLTGQFHTYSDPGRDPRRHTITTVFTATADGVPRAGDDAEQANVFLEESLPSPLAFDHADILADFFRKRRKES